MNFKFGSVTHFELGIAKVLTSDKYSPSRLIPFSTSLRQGTDSRKQIVFSN